MQDLSISIIQTTVDWEKKPQNLERFESLIKQTPTSDLIVLPEMFNTGFTMDAKKNAETMSGLTLNWLKEMASESNTAISGSLIIEKDGHFFNRFVMVQPEGSISSYDKRHLFSMAGENEVFTRGTAKSTWKINGWKICPLVCYDLRFPVWSRNVNDYDVLLYTANWPERRINHWSTLLKARAIENQCYVVAANRIGLDGQNIQYNGASVLLDFDGNELVTSIGKEEILTYTLSKESLHERRNQFPVLNDRDSFSVAGA